MSAEGTTTPEAPPAGEILDAFGRTASEREADEARFKLDIERTKARHPDAGEPLSLSRRKHVDDGETLESTLKRIESRAKEEGEAELAGLVCRQHAEEDAGVDACVAAGAFRDCRWKHSLSVCPRARAIELEDRVHDNLISPPAALRVPERESTVILASVRRTNREKLWPLDSLQVVRSALTRKRCRVPLENGAEVRREPGEKPTRHKGEVHFVGNEVIVVLAGNQGRGKCLGRGTPVLRYDGTIVAVEDLRAGDVLMGPDSGPRHVLTTSRGRGPLYRIEPTKGEPWICNDAHMMTLVHSRHGEVKDIALSDFLDGHPDPAAWLLFQPACGVEFKTQMRELPLDPYFLGAWFGDGTKMLNGVAVSKPDPEIRAVCEEMASRYGLIVRESGEPSSPTFHIVGRGGVAHGTGGGGAGNPLLDRLRNIVGPKAEVPRAYLTASRADRLDFLAGWLDTDGYLHYNNYEIVQKRRDYAEAVMFLARSLGFRVTLAEKIVNGESYWRMLIIGDCSALPLRIPRKKAKPRGQRKNPLRTGFKAVPLGEGDYFGFTLDADGRFLLGDFTVTHNTLAACYAIARQGGMYTRAAQWTRRDGIDVDEAIRAPVLVIDQFGREHWGESPWARSQVEDVLDTRSQSLAKWTFLVGNLQVETFIERLKETTITDRIIGGYGVFVEFGGESVRAGMRTAALKGQP